MNEEDIKKEYPNEYCEGNCQTKPIKLKNKVIIVCDFCKRITYEREI
jgi:hypothetical protein